MQVDRIVYFAILVRGCDVREPKPDTKVARLFEEEFNSFKTDNHISEEFKLNKRSIQYTIRIAKELGIIFRNNKLTPRGRTLAFFTPPGRISIKLPIQYKMCFSKIFLLEDYAFIKSFYDHVQKFKEIRDALSWYKKPEKRSKEQINHAFSVYINALRIAIESVKSLATRRRYLKLHRNALKRGKTAKALYHKIKPPLGWMEDINLIEKRKAHNNKILLSEKNGYKPYSRIMKQFSDYKTVVEEEKRISFLLEAYGYEGKTKLTNKEIISEIENLHKALSDPVFKVCDMDTLIDVMVVQEGLNGYQINESNIRDIIVEASKKDRYRYQILSDRYGNYRFLKIKI